GEAVVGEGRISVRVRIEIRRRVLIRISGPESHDRAPVGGPPARDDVESLEWERSDFARRTINIDRGDRSASGNGCVCHLIALRIVKGGRPGRLQSGNPDFPEFGPAEGGEVPSGVASI